MDYEIKKEKISISSRVEESHKLMLEEIAEKLGYMIDSPCRFHKGSIAKLMSAIATGELSILDTRGEDEKLLRVNYFDEGYNDINYSKCSVKVKE